MIGTMDGKRNPLSTNGAFTSCVMDREEDGFLRATKRLAYSVQHKSTSFELSILYFIAPKASQT